MDARVEVFQVEVELVVVGLADFDELLDALLVGGGDNIEAFVVLLDLMV